MKEAVKTFPIIDVGKGISKEIIPKNLHKIRAEKKWSKGVSGSGVVIAVVDTGCETSHPDLKNRIVGGYNSSGEGSIDNYEDLNGHGTHTAGIIASSHNSKGVLGVAPKSKILALKALRKTGTGDVKSLIEAIRYAIEWRGPKNEKVNVISMSLGIEEDYPELHLVIKKAIENNIIIVASSGNSGDGEVITQEYTYPSFYDEVISVGAVTNDNEISPFTSTNEDILLYAPGNNILSTYIDGSYRKLTGTSMASPHVAGVIALILEENNLQNTEPLILYIKDKLIENTKTVLTAGNSFRILYVN